MIDAAAFRRMLASGSAWVASHAAALDAINVFPVPDGDTGSNLSLTLRAANEAVAALDDDATLPDIARAASDGALLGARGNSGVIVSQWLRGLAGGLAEAERADGPALRAALAQAAAAARASMQEPREGTIISVARDLVPAEDTAAAAALLKRALTLADAAVERTPEQLPVLAAAGVVDAGARGLAVLLGGMDAGLHDEALPAVAQSLGRIDPDWLATAVGEEEGVSGFCTEFLLLGVAAGDVPDLRLALEEAGESLVLVEDRDRVRVHIHADKPEAVALLAAAAGSVSAFRAVDMRRQADEFHHRRDGVRAAVVAVVAGEGFAGLFREYGAAALVSGGATENPSAGAIAAAAESTRAADVIVLPNHANVIAAAEQAAGMAGARRLHVLPTRTQAHGLAALLGLPADADADHALEAMRQATEEIAVGEVTLAARETTAPVRLRLGQPFGLLDGEIAVAAESSEEAASELAARMAAAAGEPSLLTLYVGRDVAAPNAEALVAELERALEIEVELVIGRQPHYPYLLALE